MKINVSEKWLPIYEALASEVRIRIINLLSESSMNIKELAQNLGLSSAIVTMHVTKLEKAGIIKSERLRIKGGAQKVCTLVMDSLEIDFPGKLQKERKYHEFVVPIGHYTDFQVTPTCGLATDEKVIGYFDDPRYFLDPDRVNAKILWFTQGYVEYKIPNHILSTQEPEELEITLELGSESPGFNNNWPSDITFTINGINIGSWTSPGDFGGRRGNFTPSWWNNDINQFGLLKMIRINSAGTFMDGEKISDITLGDIDILRKQWTFRISVLEDAKHVGGLTLFGSGFGNYNQDIVFRLAYKEE